MLAIIGIIAVAAVIAYLEVPPLLKKNWKKELGVFVFLLLFGTGLSIAQALDVDIPNPMDWISMVYKPMSDGIDQVLK